ncbi:MAG: hydrogenase maturation nickel metallochaperone HypA [Candidatus Hydrogenedentes bacterium]|nr:hydrogenase maturation nickel metallochaperone HypA [Candidatus Hydrogenedentota bacterium]
MHELSLVNSILDQLEEISRSNYDRKIVRVDLKVGALEHIEPEVLKNIFDQVKEGSCAERAELVVSQEMALVRCRNCMMEYTPEDSIWICPRCEFLGGEIIKGTEIIIESVYLE